MSSIHSTAETIVNEVEYLERLNRANVPEHLHDGLVRYLVHHIKPGHFLTAVLENDLKEAMARGDAASLEGLHRLSVFLYNDAPSHAWGSPQHVQLWLGHEPAPMGVDMSGLEEAINKAVETIDGLRAQRDELLNACRLFTDAAHEARDILNGKGFACPASIAFAAEKARNAIAAAEGKAS